MKRIHRNITASGKLPIPVYKRNRDLRSSHKESQSVYVIGKIIHGALDYVPSYPVFYAILITITFGDFYEMISCNIANLLLE